MAKVLVADDSIAVRKVAERLLVGAGLEVALAANGEEAMAQADRNPPDLVVSDVIMPDKSGYEVCAYIRSHAALSATPVLLISGIVNDEVTKQAESCQASGVLKKPFQGTSLQDRVLELLAKRSAAVAVQPGVSAGLAPASVAAVPPPAAPTPPPEPVAAAPMQPAGPPKAYKITEEQLQEFKAAAARIKELEQALAEAIARAERAEAQAAAVAETQTQRLTLDASLADAQAANAELERRLVAFAGTEAKLAELEQRLEVAQQAGDRLAEAVGRAEAAEIRVAELEGLLTSNQGRSLELSQVTERLNEAEARAHQLETALAEAQAQAQAAAEQAAQQTSASSGVEARVQELEGLLALEQASAAGLANELQQRQAVLEQQERRLAELDALLKQEQARSAEAAALRTQLEQAEQRLDRMKTQPVMPGALSASDGAGLAEQADKEVVRLQALLDQERARSTYLLQRLSGTGQAETKPAAQDDAAWAELRAQWRELDARLSDERTHAAQLVEQAGQAQQAAIAAQDRIEALGKALADLSARMASS